MANDARGGLSPEDAERFASAIRPLWDSIGPEAGVASQTHAHGVQPQVPPAAPSGPRELFGSTPDDSILGMSPSAHYKATRASQPPMNEVILPRLDRTLVMNSPTPPAAVAAVPAAPAMSPFTKAPGADGNANHGILQSDLRLSTPSPPPAAGADAYLMDDVVLPKQSGGKNALFVLAILAGVGVGGVLALRFIGTTPATATTTPTATAAPSATEATVLAVPSVTAAASVQTSAVAVPTAPSASVVASANPSASAVATASAAPIASAAPPPVTAAQRAPVAPVAAGRVPDVSFVGPSSANASASKPQSQPKPAAAKAEAPKPTAAPKGTGGGIVRDAPF